MRILGAILAGGRATRFGSDKALAMLEGRPLIAHVADALAAQADAVVVCGREWGALPSLPDRPAPGMGPLGGLCAALRHAAGEGYDAVLSAGCDTLPIPKDLIDRLIPAPACIASQPTIGLWPASLAPLLDEHLATTTDLSLRGWARLCGAIGVECGATPTNLNTPADLARYARATAG
ncbi:MAG: molybdenum cofactor guanylyltransferase [Sphingomonadaceae bacterium]|nr:molybdenum cofactor guanylyltransferase [Sphingomonadaceae bacterium]